MSHLLFRVSRGLYSILLLLSLMITQSVYAASSPSYSIDGGQIGGAPLTNSSGYGIPCGAIVQGTGVSTSPSFSITPGLTCDQTVTTVTFKIDPEKRVAVLNPNKSVLKLQLYLRQTGSTSNAGYIYVTPLTLNLSTDVNGDSTSSFTLTAAAGVYDMAVKTESHLTLKRSIVSVAGGNLFVDFTSSNTVTLKAGDINLTDFGDDTVNSLDIGTILTSLNNNIYRNDLNQDTTVNSLDIGILINNLNKNGD
jgi:hypothetical protein